LPENILKATLKDLNVWVEQYQRELSITGLTNRILGWMMSHLNGELFKIGRLQFQCPFAFNNDTMVFLHKTTNEIQVLAGNDIRYNHSGLIDGIGSVWDEDAHWTSTLQETADFVEGNPISIAGYAENRLVKLEFTEWTNVLRRGDNTLNIHIPAGEPMTPEMCTESFEQAKQFFDKYFPDYNAKAFVCFSWLLDNQFENILKPTSNIIRFQHLGRTFPIGGESEAIYRIFGPTAVKEGIDAVNHTSSMQRAIAEFIHGGGVLRNGGFFLRT
jgi:GNAT domain-containint protein